MDAIRNIKTMAGSPDADLDNRGQRLAILRMVFVFQASFFREPMKEDRNVQNSFVEIDWGGRPLRLETGKIARQADGAVLATYGETVVLATVVAAKSPREGVDFLPLTVDYQEKTYAAGRIPGGYFKREGRPTEKETLVSRLIDRPIRPLFVDGWRNETQVIVTVLSHDMENDPDIVALVACSAALTFPARPSRARSARPVSASSTTNTCSTRRSTKWSRPSSTSSSPAPPMRC